MARYLTSALRDGYLLPRFEELAKLEDVDIRPKRKIYRPRRRFAMKVILCLGLRRRFKWCMIDMLRSIGWVK